MIFKKGSRKVAAGCTHASVSARTKPVELMAAEDTVMVSMVEASIICKLDEKVEADLKVLAAGVTNAIARLARSARNSREY